jgi:outer membrane protein assembly factor BamA
VLFLLYVFLAITAQAADKTNAPPAAKFKVSGYGFFGNLRLKHIINLLEIPNGRPEFFDADFMEDSALILESKLRGDGYLRPQITIRIVKDDNTRVQFVWNQNEPLPRLLRARRVEFRIQKGVLYHYKELQFTGLTAISERRAENYFIETSGLIPLKKNRFFSPEHLNRSVASLGEVLDRMGFQEQSVTVGLTNQDDRNGNVFVRIDVDQGPKFIVRSVRQEAFFPDTSTNAPVDVRTNWPMRNYSKLWEQDFTHGIRTNYYAKGYPDTSVAIQTENREPVGTNVLLDLRARVTTGPRVRTGDVSFEGNKRTRESILARRVPLHTGDWLNRLQAERGQYRIARLGVFDSVQLNYETVSSNLWDVRYDLKEGKQIEISPLFGFGSYDLVRGGVEVQQYNLWGRAHNSDLKLVQSVKSSSADYTYSVPQLFAHDIDAFATGNYLRRQEISFLRTEYGGGAGIRRNFREIATDTALRYNFGILQASQQSANFVQVGAQNPLVGEFILDVRHDRRDSPLDPRRGYELLGNFELASQYLGGDANFQRAELGGSYHIPLNNSQWLHLGLRHGLVGTTGVTSNNLPFVRRFFPGGENSVRGYQEGEASPRNAQGQIIGAETYTLGNIEFEQGLTPKWSIVGFLDAVEFAENLNHYPGDTSLFSVGGGIRWRTIIGPVRVEYGQNLNPRPRDPSGEIQFSLGFPF